MEVVNFPHGQTFHFFFFFFLVTQEKLDKFSFFFFLKFILIYILKTNKRGEKKWYGEVGVYFKNLKLSCQFIGSCDLSVDTAP